MPASLHPGAHDYGLSPGLIQCGHVLASSHARGWTGLGPSINTYDGRESVEAVCPFPCSLDQGMEGTAA